MFNAVEDDANTPTEKRCDIFSVNDNVVTSKDVRFSDNKNDIPAEMHGEPFIECKIGVKRCSIKVVGNLENEAVDAENGVATDEL